MARDMLRRYTELPSLIHILKEKQITLLDPQSWDDTNDSYYLSVYREKKKLKTVLALCFSMSEETYHHWRVFAPGSGGTCIKFDAAEILSVFSKVDDVSMGMVKYLTLEKAKAAKISIDRLPFLKRYAFQHEQEYRVIYESASKRAGLGSSDRSISGMAAIFSHGSRSHSDETTETQPLAGLQGEGGFGSIERREDDRAAGHAV